MTTKTLAEALGAEFDAKQVLHFQGRGGMTFDYIEDETVMDRLDEVIGVGNWSVTVDPISVADGIVKVTLHALVNGQEAKYEDFGYQTRDGGESLKEAVSDGIRRCGRYLGIGRYLYRKHDSTNGNGRAAAPPARPPAAPQRPVTHAPAANGPSEPEWMDGGPAPHLAAVTDTPTDPRDGYYGDTCPVHKGRPWKDTPYGPKCTAKDAETKSGFCSWKPSKRWIAEHEVATA